MQALTFKNGGVEVGYFDDPLPGSGQLVVDVKAAGLNGADILQMKGLYPAPPGSPKDIPGLEFSGIISQLGSGVVDWKVGERVMAIVGGGGQGQKVVVDSSHLVKVPDSIDLINAGGFPEAFFCAYDALIERGNLKSGEKVLITGASGGVGCAAIQISSLQKANVIAQTRNMSHVPALLKLGASKVVDLLDGEALREEGPYDVVLDLIGGNRIGDNLSNLALGGRYVVIGVGAGSKVEIDLLGIMAKRAFLTGSTLRARTVGEKADLTKLIIKNLLPSLANDLIQIPVTKVFNFEEASDAYSYFKKSGKLGKVVVTF